MAGRVELAGGLLASVLVPRARDDQETVPGELPGHLMADPAVGAGDHRDGSRVSALAGCPAPGGCHGVAAGDSDGGRNAAKGWVTTRVRLTNR